MRLHDVFQGLAVGPLPVANPEVTGACIDSRRVRPGDLFVALRGHHRDGGAYAASAVRAGATAILSEGPLSSTVPVVVSEQPLTVLSPVAARIYGEPSRALAVVGVTGTNGKTTITYLLESIFREAGLPAGVMGTVEYRWPGGSENAGNTTPFASDVQRLLRAMADAGVTHVAMEASSHALVQHRVDDVHFSVAVFTNLTQDHLDYHGTMESYFEAKASLFDRLTASAPVAGSVRGRGAVINIDDPWGDRFVARVRGDLLTYGLDRPADLRASDVAMSAQETRFHLRTPFGDCAIRFPLVGRHNVYNALAAVGAALRLGIPLESAARGLASPVAVPGRLERVTERPAGTPAERSVLPFGVFVDYAHTDDALQNVLRTLRPVTRGRLIVVFGCGGDRDRTKRPIMGASAATLADAVIITSDNPRSEDPAAIATEIESGILGEKNRGGRTADYEVHLDRGEALRRAVQWAQPGDVVLVAGKGHETYQIFRDRTEPFDDRAVVRGLLVARAGTGGAA